MRLLLYICCLPILSIGQVNMVFEGELPREVSETSGFTTYNSKLYTLNDSGGEASIYELDSLGNVVAEVVIDDVENEDWESLESYDSHFYVGDFGNNGGSRKDLVIYKGKKKEGKGVINVEAIRFKYEDQESFKYTSRKTNFDCEAMTVMGDSILLFSKDWSDLRTRVYVLPNKPGDHVAKVIAEYDVKGLVTGSTYDSDNQRLVLTCYDKQFRSYLVTLRIGENGLSKDFQKIELTKLIGRASQIEAIDYHNGEFSMSREALRIKFAGIGYDNKQYFYRFTLD